MINIKRIPTTIELSKFLVTFSYQTKKGKYREQQRFIYSTRDYVEGKFKKWANSQRTMSNVKILGIIKTDEEPKIIDV